MQKVIAFLVKKVITVVMIVFSFFIKGDMTKVEMQPEEQVKAGASSATFIFENKNGKKRLTFTSMSNPLKWRKTANGRKCRMCRCSTTWISSILPIFIRVKRRISQWNSSREPSIPSLFPCPWRQAITV